MCMTHFSGMFYSSLVLLPIIQIDDSDTQLEMVSTTAIDGYVYITPIGLSVGLTLSLSLILVAIGMRSVSRIISVGLILLCAHMYMHSNGHTPLLKLLYL